MSSVKTLGALSEKLECRKGPQRPATQLLSPMARDEHDSQIQQLSAVELKAMLDSGAPFELVDVRTPEEREIASIGGARLLDQAYHDVLLTLDRDTSVVFQCHHGIRSQRAAEYFREQGFRRLYNLSGGIDAWSIAVDPSTPRY